MPPGEPNLSRLASTVLTVTHCAATGRRRLQAELERARTEIALLREELRIKDGRWERSRSRRRPHYTPIQRMRILQLRAARRPLSPSTATRTSSGISCGS